MTLCAGRKSQGRTNDTSPCRTHSSMNIFGDKTIKAGDLAMVVRDCCGRYLGRPVRVTKVFFVSDPAVCTCTRCRREYSNIDVAAVEASGTMIHAALFWLKKIDPPQQSVDERTEEELHA